MGKLQTFSIKFGRADRCYVAGEGVTGLVIINLAKEKKVKKVKLKLKGRCEVRYKEMENDDGEFKLVEKKAKEKYFEYEVKIFEDDYLPCGETHLPFNFPPLPGDLPSSYEDSGNGNLVINIRYYAKCKIDSKKGDHETMALFTVQQKMELDSFPDCWERRTAHDDKYICCLCCK